MIDRLRDKVGLGCSVTGMEASIDIAGDPRPAEKEDSQMNSE